MRILSFDKNYLFELMEGNKLGEYEIVFPQLSITLNYTQEEGFYKKQITRDNQKKVFEDLEAKITDEIERKEYLSSEEGQKQLKEDMEALSYTIHYKIYVDSKEMSIDKLVENHNITDNNNIITQNIELE